MNDLFALHSLEPRRLMAGGTILFVRGAERSGGFLEATNDTQRTEQLADISNKSTAAGNHGWASLAALLRGEGYAVRQIAEPLEANAPARGQTTGRAIAFEDLDLTPYRAIVMASNNAVYGRAQTAALDAYVRAGGGVLFISDGNFGSSWADAPASDNAFLSRYGLAFNQDNGQYALRRSAGDFVAPDEAILRDVDAFDGEGVSPVRIVGRTADGAVPRRIVRARGDTYDNNPASSANDARGRLRPVDRGDAALALLNAGAGRVAAYFDRNTFFNANGAGTSLSRNDNRQFAKNLFNWVADNTPPAITTSTFTQSPRRLTFRLDDNLAGTLTRADIRLRHRRTAAAIAGRDWTLSLREGNGYTDVTIAIAARAAAGPYQLQIGRGAIADDSGNVRRGAIRYAFTIVSSAASTYVFSTRAVAGSAIAGRLASTGVWSALDGDDDASGHPSHVV